MRLPADDPLYAALAAEVRAFAGALPQPLPALCAPFLDELLAGPFAPIAALLPTWLCDLLPIPAATARRLGAAQLFGWWYAAARDAMLDGQGPPELTLGGGVALLRAVTIYGELGLPALPCWPRLAGLEARAAAAYARERASQPGAGPITAAHLAPWGFELIADRAASLHFAVYAQMDLAGLPTDDSRRVAIHTALRRLVTARQLGDDAGDWLDDLRAGRLNAASAALARPLLEGAGAEGASIERLAAWLTADEEFWERWWEVHAAFCEEGQAALSPFGPARLDTLLAVEAERGVAAARAGAAWRAEARALFGA